MINEQSAIASFGKSCAIAVLTIGLAVGLSGCSGYDVELQGGIFDALGVSGSTNSEAGEPKVARRNGLIIPPDTQKLPEPGSGNNAVTANAQSWPVDPEKAKKAKIAYKEKRLAKYCDERDWWLRSKPEEFNEATRNGELCLSPIAKIYYQQKKANGG